MIKLERKTITIALRKGGKDIKAWVYNNLLAAHKEHNVWCITHIPTGYRVFYFQGKYKYIRPLIADIFSIIDWNSDNCADILARVYDDGNKTAILTTLHKFENME